MKPISKRIQVKPSRENYCNVCNSIDGEYPEGCVTLSYSNTDAGNHTVSTNLCPEHLKEMALVLVEALGVKNN